jgi:lactate dehydrogenase-like 2-hydroxyacid dehydrogenase
MTRKPTVLVTRKLPKAVETRLAQNYTPRFNEADKLYAPEELITQSVGADALLITPSDRLTADVIDKLPDSIRAIATFSVGYDHIDLKAAEKRGILVINTPDVLTDATADLTLLLLLGAARRASEGERIMRQGTWSGVRPTELLGTQVTGKRLGILGMGRIGQAVAHRARAFSMEIHYCNRKRLPPEVEFGAIFHSDPDDLLPESDFFSLHCPATPETVNFLNAQRIALLPDGAIAINAARGSLVNDDDLIAALKSGKIAGAGLDVYNGEPDIHPAYRTLPNAFLLPHIGSATKETRNQMGFIALDNLDAIFAGKIPPNLVK